MRRTLSAHHIIVIFSLLLLLGAPGCTSTVDQQLTEPPDTAAGSDPAASQVSLNTLTEEEKAEGWQLLFNGENLENWRGYQMEDVPPGWEVSDGAIYFNAEQGGEGHSDLTTREQFADFELKLDWKISQGGNSGVFFRVTENHEQEYMTGPEIQVIDPSRERYPGLDATRAAGSNYGLHAPTKEVARPAGEWNAMRIVVNGAHVEHWLNAEKIVEYELWTDEWKEMVAKTKFAAWPDYGMNKTGYIVLQDHGAPVWYRNIKIKPLS
ncbi:MAG: 3-keto-disaccharide hydrolase [Acidobacteriota bacterium]